MFGIITKKYHDRQISSLKKEFDQMLSARGFNMAKVDRLTADWLSFVKDYNYDLRAAGTKLIARARNLYQNDPFSKKLVAEKRKGIIGPNGFVLRNKAGEFQVQNGKYKFVKDDVANGIINEQWWQFAKNKYINYESDETLRAHCGTLIDTVMVDGEVFIYKLPGNYNPFGFTTQIITSEYCDWTLNKQLDNGNYVVMGVEVDQQWRKIAYWFRKDDPQSAVNFGGQTLTEHYRIPADKIIHLYVKELAHQLRGVTLFAPVGLRLKMLYSFEESSLVRANISARVPGMIEKQPQVMGANGTPVLPATEKNDDDDWIMSLANGEFLKVKDGYKINNLESDYPHQLQGEFQKHMLRAVSAGADIGFSTLSNNYEAVTWHSGKLEKQAERDAFVDAQNWFIESYLNKIFGDPYCWLETAALKGRFVMPSGKTLPVLEKFEKFNQPIFYGRTWEYTNPVEDVTANIIALQSFQKTFEQVLAEQGLDFEEQLDSIANEKELFNSKGLGDLYSLLMTKYNVIPFETSAKKDAKENNSNNNGDGKAHAINIHS